MAMVEPGPPALPVADRLSPNDPAKGRPDVQRAAKAAVVCSIQFCVLGPCACTLLLKRRQFRALK